MQLSDLPAFPLKRTRTHEVCGPGAYVFALALAAKLDGKTIWIKESWNPAQINPNGILEFINPASLTICKTRSHNDSLAVGEEALRSGAVELVIINVNNSIGLTEGRRLQLAARDGGSTGLVIVPEGTGSNAAETRWRCSPVFSTEDSTVHRWELNKNKSGTLGVWYVRWDAASCRVIVVSKAGE